MLGYSLAEMTQMSFKQITHPEDLENNLEQMKLLFKGQINEVSTEKRYIRKDGTTLYANLKVSSMREIPDWKKNHIAIIEDISERKKSDKEIKEKEQKFKTVFDQSPIGLVLFDNDGKFLDCNPACLSMFGIDTTNTLKDFDFFNAPNFSEQQKKEIKEGKKVRFEMKFDFDLVKRLNLYQTKKTGQFYMSCFSTSFKIQEKNETGILLHLIDITERKKAEIILREENNRFRASMDAMDAVVYVADMENFDILFVNKYVKEIFGDIIGQKCYSVLQGKSTPCDFCTNHLLIDANGKVNQPHVWEFQNLVSKRWYQCHDQAIHWTNGKLVRFEMANDITVNKENELTLKENEILLRQLNSTKDKFFSIIAHDLKNPFTVLKTGSELLSIYLEKNDLENSKAKATMIANTIRHGYTLLENLLAWAKSQTDGIKFEPKKINFRNSVSKNIMEVEDHAIEKNIVIKNEIPEEMVLTADINLLSVVFRNLITNAIKFTHNGGSITITAKAENDCVEVAVIDTGIGIPKEHQYKLFRLDANFSRTGTANEASTSLGLILCKEFIERHKGKIWVESEENKGSEFRFTLPN
jgi:PAS domain S-box-containing protein